MVLLAASGAAAEAPGRIILQTSPLAGFQYHAGRAVFPLLEAGDALTLVREPDNPYDARAVRVEWRGTPIGYVPRRDNADLARLIDSGVRVSARVVHVQKARDPWKRVLFEVLIEE